MKQQTKVHIATPCHEDWNAMTPAKDGKFCAACSKQVVDFTLMSDAQILQFVSKQNSGLCGRFDAGQLQRPLVQPAVSKKKSWYLALALPFTLLLQKGFGQKGDRKLGKPVVMTEQKTKDIEPVVLGKLMAPPVSEWLTINGILINEAGQPVASASVVLKGAADGSLTDSAGRFSVRLRRNKDSVMLAAYAVGYKTLEQKVRGQEAVSELVLTLTRVESTLKEVVVTSYDSEPLRVLSGGLISYRSITYAEKIDSTIRKAMHLNPFTVYPNPVQSGGTVHINFRKADAYEIQLLNSASVLLQTQTMQTVNDAATVTFQLPTQMAAGIYYMRLLSRDKEHSYLEKLLVK